MYMYIVTTKRNGGENSYNELADKTTGYMSGTRST
jgi:hypothetical protein